MQSPPASVQMCYLALIVLEQADRFVPSLLLRKVMLKVRDDPEMRNVVVEAMTAVGAVSPMGQGKGRLYHLTEHGAALLESYRKWYEEPDSNLIAEIMAEVNS